MKLIYKLTLLLILNIVFTQESKFEYIQNDSKLNFNLGELSLNEKDGFTSIKSQGFGSISLSGYPDLPIFSTLYQIPKGKNIEVDFTVVGSHFVNNIKLRPFTLDKNTVQNEKFISSSNFPIENLLISEPQVLRDIQFVKISVIPFNYDSQTETLEVFDQIELYINEIESSDTFSQNIRKPSKEFEKLYRDLFSNYSERNEEDYQDPAILYICGGNVESNSDFQDLVEWRKQRGFIVYTESVSSIGNSTSSIKSFIQNAYNNFDPAPEHVALVGDVGGSYNIPTYQGDSYGFGHNTYGNACEGDHPYSMLDGNDLYPEVLIGRMSVRTSGEIENVVNKIIHYEKATYMDYIPDYFETASLVGDPSTSGNSCAITNEYVAELLENHGFDDVRLKTSGSSYDSWMRNNLEDGVLFFNYRGYLGVSGFGSGDIDGANNGFKLPFATVLTCGTNSFAEDNSSLTEYFFKAGSVENPRGAVAAVGTATWNTHTLFNNIVNMGMYDGLFGKKLETAGAALASGKLALDMTYPGDPDDWISAFTHWNNLIGDPATHLWTTTPKLLTATYNNSISFGTNYIDVQVNQSNGNPLENARVTLLKGNEIFSNSYTDNNGFVEIPLEYSTSGNISLVVTDQGYKPHVGSVNIQSPNGDVVNLDPDNTIEINDNSGNNNGQLNPGETVELSIPIKNFGNSTATNLSIEISSTSEFVTITNGSQTYNNISAGQSANVGGFSFSLDSGTKHNEDLNLLLTISNGQNEWYSQLNLKVEGYDFEFVNSISWDGSSINPGEVQGFNVNLTNSGSILSHSITGILSTNFPEITITNNEVDWNSINPNSNSVSNSLFVMDISNSVVNGTYVDFELELTTSSGYSKVIPFEIQIGRINDSDPSGPDEYGYYIYDSNDLLYDLVPIYDWIEIDPGFGGNGQSLNLNHYGNGEWGGNGPSTHVELPFQFSFYGTYYDVITVCTNGWISFGESNSEAFRNYSIPGAGGPPAMVAAFWDDLKTSQGNVYTYADPNNEYFIIEWSNMRTYDQNSDEDFQIILYNNSVMPYGDGEIKIQYKTFNNTSIGNFNAYPPSHGSYATIGIENELTDIGLEYSFYNNYMEGASELDDQTALFITTRSPIPLPVPVMTYNHESMDFTVNIDSEDYSSLSISNQGEDGSSLTYSVSKTGVNPFEVIGGGDSYGNIWSDSDLSQMIDYNWIDIEGTGTQLSFPHNDVSADPIQIGFEFDFYGETYTECIVNPNGWVGFGEDNTTWSNTNLPSNSAPRPAIFGHWDDLNPVALDPAGCPEGQGNVYYKSFEDKLVIWFDNVARCTTNPDYVGSFDFQFVLYENGDIDLNYREMTGNTSSATTGMQNADGTSAIVVVYDGDYVQSQHSVKFRELDNVEWLLLEGELQGELWNGESETIDISVNTSGLDLGDYNAEILLSSSIQPTITIPVTMSVTDNFLLGDVNFDEQINVTDIVLMVSFILGQIDPTSDQEITADMNGDGLLNVVDIVLIVDIILQ